MIRPEVRCLMAWLACAGSLAAQQVPAPAAPAAPPVGVLLLLSEPRVLDAETLRATIERSFRLKLAPKPPADGRGNWLQAAGDGAAMRIGGALIRLSASATRWQVDGAPRTDADDEAALEAVKDHKAYLLLEAAERPADPAQRAALHEVTGRIAADLLGPDCLAVALLEHGSFRSMDAIVAVDLKGTDQRRAFAPLAVAGAIVLLSGPRSLDATAVRTAATRAFGVEFPERSEDPEGDFVLVYEKSAVIRHAGAGYVIECVGEPALGVDAVQGSDPAVLKAVGDHKSALFVASGMRPLDAGELTVRYAKLGRLIAELLDADCLAVSFRADRSLHVLDASAAEKLRSSDPPAAFRAKGRKP